jgi:hypothetical protein
MRLLLILLSACQLAGAAHALEPQGETGAHGPRLLTQDERWFIFANGRREWRDDDPAQFGQAQQEDRRHTGVWASDPRGAGIPAIGRTAADTPCSP